MSVTHDADEIVSEIQIAAAPERVFQALVDPAQVPQWWGQTSIYRCKVFEADLRVGGKWRSLGIGPDGKPFEVTGEYLQLERPWLIEHTWVASWTGPAKTVVHWELTPTEQGTLLRLRHRGLAAYPEITRSYRGWPRMLSWLQAFVERGKTVEAR